MSSPDSSKVIMRALRRQGHEAQLTQLLAAVASDDDEVASALARAFVKAAPTENAAELAKLGEIPPALRCRAEATLHALQGKGHGRVDLRFDDDASDFTLLAELKLHSGYGHDQVKRYRDALEELPPDRNAALIAVTRNVPGAGEPEPGTDGWLGSVRWTDIYDDLLASAPAMPATAVPPSSTQCAHAGSLRPYVRAIEFAVPDTDAAKPARTRPLMLCARAARSLLRPTSPRSERPLRVVHHDAVPRTDPRLRGRVQVYARVGTVAGALAPPTMPVIDARPGVRVAGACGGRL